jgi:glyoxylase-like metal-dependent hydrolase (beta-lactamase superfamily II)
LRSARSWSQDGQIEDPNDAAEEMWCNVERARVIDTPGHTVGHIAYWFESAKAL